MNIRSLKISQIVSLSHSAFCFPRQNEVIQIQNKTRLRKWSEMNFPFATWNAHCALHTVLSFIPVSHSVFCFIFITTLNTVWCWTKPCLNPWKTNLPRSCRMLTFKAAIKSHLDLFSKGISRWICMFLLWLWTLWEWFTSSILPCWDKTRPSPMMEWSVPALLSHTHTCTVCDSRQ